MKKAFNWTKNKTRDLGSFINKNLTDLIDWAKKPTVPKPKPSLSHCAKEELEEHKSFYQIIKTGENSNRKFSTFFDICVGKIIKIGGIIYITNVLLDVMNKVVKDRRLQTMIKSD